jgi:hypothetical protein
MLVRVWAVFAAKRPQESLSRFVKLDTGFTSSWLVARMPCGVAGRRLRCDTMPTVTVTRADVPRDEAMEAVRQQLGSDYKVKPGGHDGVFSVDRGTLSGAKVHIKPNGESTEFHVHGTGIIIGRIVNEFGIARKVASAISNSSLTQS